MHHIYFFQNKKIKKCEKRCKYHRSTLSSYCTKVIYAGSVIFYGFDILLSFLWVYQISTQSILKINHLAVQTKTKQFSIGIHYAVKTTLKEKLCGLKLKPYTFIPFGLGPRNCVGLKFALMEIKLALCKLIIKFKFHPCSKTQNPMKFNTVTPFLQTKFNYLNVENRVINLVDIWNINLLTFLWQFQ